MITRRSLFGILAGAVAAPIVVRSGLLMPVKALVVPEITIDIDAVGDGMAAGMRTYVVTHTYPANAFYFMPGDIIKMSGFSNLAPGKIDMAGFSAEAIA